MRVALCKFTYQHGSLLMADVFHILTMDMVPEDMDELLEDFEADFYEVLDD